MLQCNFQARQGYICETVSRKKKREKNERNETNRECLAKPSSRGMALTLQHLALWSPALSSLLLNFSNQEVLRAVCNLEVARANLIGSHLCRSPNVFCTLDFHSPSALGIVCWKEELMGHFNFRIDQQLEMTQVSGGTVPGNWLFTSGIFSS